MQGAIEYQLVWLEFLIKEIKINFYFWGLESKILAEIDAFNPEKSSQLDFNPWLSEFNMNFKLNALNL